METLGTAFQPLYNRQIGTYHYNLRKNSIARQYLGHFLFGVGMLHNHQWKTLLLTKLFDSS